MKRFQNKIISTLQEKLQLDRYDVCKLILLAGAYFFIVGSYSILRSLKTSLFLGFVGKEFQPISRIISLFVIFPCGFFYSLLVDKLKRQQIFYAVIGTYAVLSIVFTIFLAHPDFGVKNEVVSPYRILGWAFEVFMDLYSALVITTFWGYANSISTPDFANKGYGPLTAISRFGGISTPLLGLLFLHKLPLATHVSIPILTFLSGLFLLSAMWCIRKLVVVVPAAKLHGYEAAYKQEVASEKEEEKQHKKHPKADLKPSVFEGIRLMLTQPYVMGIFGLVYCFEFINVIFDYQMQVLMSIEMNNKIGAMSSFMFIYTSSFQTLGLVFALFGTSTLLKRVGTLYCLLIMPSALMGLSIILFVHPSLYTVFAVMIIMRALNYGFNYPIRETLYIPTVKDVQFKAKLWIDSFGKTLSKSSGSAFNHILLYFAANPLVIVRIDSMYCIAVSCFYAVISLLVGKKYQKTIRNNEVIGANR